MPALNEERNILPAIQSTLKAFGDLTIKGEIIVVNDGSTDHTEALIQEMMVQDSRVRMLKHEKPEGIGASFWDGVQDAQQRFTSTGSFCPFYRFRSSISTVLGFAKSSSLQISQ